MKQNVYMIYKNVCGCLSVSMYLFGANGHRFLFYFSFICFVGCLAGFYQLFDIAERHSFVLVNNERKKNIKIQFLEYTN